MRLRLLDLARTKADRVRRSARTKEVLFPRLTGPHCSRWPSRSGVLRLTACYYPKDGVPEEEFHRAVRKHAIASAKIQEKYFGILKYQIVRGPFSLSPFPSRAFDFPKISI